MLHHYSADIAEYDSDIASIIMNRLSRSYITMAAVAKTRSKPAQLPNDNDVESTWRFFDVEINQYVGGDHVCFLQTLGVAR